MVERIDSSISTRGVPTDAQAPSADPKFQEFCAALEERLGRAVEPGLARSLFDRREAAVASQAQSRETQAAFESERSSERLERSVDQSMATATGRTQDVRAGELSSEDRANILNLRHGPVLPPLSPEAQVFDQRAEATLERMLGPILSSVEVGGERPDSLHGLVDAVSSQSTTPSSRGTTTSVGTMGLGGAQVTRSQLSNQVGNQSPSLSLNLAGGVTPRSRAVQGDGFVSSMRLDTGSINLDAFIMLFLAKYLEESNEHRASLRNLSRLEGELQVGFKDLEIALTKVQQRYERLQAYLGLAKSSLNAAKSGVEGATVMGGAQSMDVNNPDAAENIKAIEELSEHRKTQQDSLTVLLGPESIRETLAEGELNQFEVEAKLLPDGPEKTERLEAIDSYRQASASILTAYGPVTRRGEIDRELASPAMAASDAPGRAELVAEGQALDEEMAKETELFSQIPFGWGALRKRRPAIASRFEFASRELARVDAGEGRYAEMGDDAKADLKETLVGMRKDALYAISAYDDCLAKKNPLNGESDFVDSMKAAAASARAGRPAEGDQPEIAADPLQAEYIETLIGERTPDTISVGIANEEAELRNLESKAKAGREVYNYRPLGQKIIEGTESFLSYAQGTINAAVQASGQNALKAVGGAQAQLASAKREAEGMLSQQLQRSQRMMERLLMALAMSRRS